MIGFLCSLVNFQAIEFDSSDHWVFVNAVITVILFPVFALFPILAVWIVINYWHQLGDSDIKKKFGEIYDGYNIKSKTMILYWSVQYLRKILLAIVVTVAQNEFWLQTIVFFATSTAIITTLKYTNARASKLSHFLDIFNEVKLNLIVYHMMLFTMFVPDPEIRQKIGYSCFALMSLAFVINISNAIITPIRACFKL